MLKSICSPNTDLFRSILIIFAILFFATSRDANASTIVVPAGGNIQAAINAAQLGDTIVLQAGATYETPGDFIPYTLTNKGSGSGYITITSSVPAPADGTRVTLANRANMPKLVVKKGSTFFDALRGAHHYRLSNLWFTNKQGGTTTQLLGINGEDITHPDPRDPQVDWPHDIIVDHCFFNPVEWDMYPEANLCSSVNTAVGLVGINVTIRDSMMKGFGARYGSGVGANQPGCGTVALDGESVLIVTAPGPMLIDNNQMEEWFVAFFIGGGDPGSMYGSTVLASPAPTLTSATLSNVVGLNVGDNIAFEMNSESPTFGGITVAAGTVTSINGNSVTFTHLVGKWGTNDNYTRLPVGVRPKTVSDPGGVAPCTNNYLGAPKWCSKAYWNGWVPSNITITHNYINKPTRWYNYMGSDGKGFFEIKLCDTCLIDGNIFEGKTGFTVTVRNQGGRAPWSRIRNLTMSNNLATQFSAGFYSLFYDNEQLSQEASNIVFHNNLMYGEYDDSANSGFLPRLFSGFYGDNVKFTHNTVLQSGRIMAYGHGPEMAGISELTNFVFRDNIVNFGTGWQTGYACFDGPLNVCTPNYIWTKNAMIGAPTGPINEVQTLASFPGGNWNPANLSAVGFTNPAAGNYRLLSSSPYYRAASDGKDVGVDMDQLLAHLNGPIPVPSPTPTPSVTPTPSPTPTPTSTPTPTPTVTPSPTPTPSGTVAIKGYVFAGGVQIPGALVQVAGQSMLSRVSDAFFWFDGGIPIGSTIVVTKAGYTFPQVTVQAGVPEQLYFVQGSTTTNPTPTPTPTPTPNPTPAPTPTPTPAPMAVSMTVPTTNATFSLGANVTYGATASHTSGGSVSSVAFNGNSLLIGTATQAPYTVVSSTLPAGVYSVTAVARDAQGLTVSSNPITVKISKALRGVRNGKKNASTIEGSFTNGFTTQSGESSMNSAALDALAVDLGQVYLDFASERVMFASERKIDKYLFAAVFLARSGSALSKQQTPTIGVRDRLKKIESYLSFCEDLMVDDAISGGTLSEANRVNASVDLVITHPETTPVGLSGSILLSNGIGKVSALTSIPFTTQTISGPSYELGDVTVTIGGHAASLLSVSPTEITFTVPSGLSGGVAEVLVTSREGYISHGTAAIAGLNPTIFVNVENPSQAAILDGLSIYSGGFSTTTPGQFFGLDLRTRLSILATGISTGISNTDFSNDVWLANGQLQPNLAESVVIEARRSNGTIVTLPVEYAGAQGVVAGLDQIIVMLPAGLQGAGSVQLTVIAGGVRGNPVTIVVQ